MANVVPVHGAWCDGSSWSGVVAALQAGGHAVRAAQLPLSSLDDDVAAARRAVAAFDGPVALVGHSYGGAVISAAADGLEQVRGLVFVAAYMPDAGETVLGLGERFDPSPGGAAIRATETGWLTLDPDSFAEVFAADVAPDHAAVLAAVQAPTHGSCFQTPLPAAAWHGVESVYVRSTQDEMIQPDLQSFLAERAGSRLVSLDSSHASPVSHAREVADAIADAAQTLVTMTA